LPSSRARRAAARRSAARRRRWLAGAATVGIALIAAVTLLAVRSGDGRAAGGRPAPSSERDGSTALSDRAGRLRIDDEPASYRIVYRVETYTGDERMVTRDELAIRRPFDGRTRKLAGPDAGDDVRSEQIGVLGRLFVPEAPSADEALLETGPSIAPSDLRIAPVLDDLVAADRAERREWREVAGEPCQVVRFGGPVTSGTIAARLQPDVEYADACVSERGLVLEELWVVEGLVQRRRLAVEVDADAVVPASTFAPAADTSVDPLPVDKGGGSFRAVEPASAYAAPFWVADAPPLGTYRGRWAIVEPAATDPNDEETKERRVGAVADVWSDGVGAVIVEQGSTAGGVSPFELGDGPRIVVDGLGEGEIVFDLRTSEVRFRRPGGYFLRVRGTVSAGQLEAIARSLRRTEGGTGLVYLDE
jgi:hypothetical protein